MKLYFGAIKGTRLIRAADTVFVCHVAGVDKVLGVNMLKVKVIEASTAPHLEPGEPQDESVQHLVSVLARGLLRAGAGGTQAIVAGPLLQSPNDLLARDHRLTLWPGDRVRERLFQ